MTDVFIGDSIVEGNELNHSGQGGTNDINQRWSFLFTAANGHTLDQYSQSGRTLSTANGGGNSFESHKTDIPTYSAGTHSMLFFYFGGNDVYLGGGYSSMHTAFVSKYLEMIQYIKTTKGWPSNKIVCCWMYWSEDIPAYNITVTGMATLWAEVVTNVIEPEGVGRLDFGPAVAAETNKAFYSLNPANSVDDKIHPQNHPTFHANQFMADNTDSLTVFPTPPVTVKYGRLA